MGKKSGRLGDRPIEQDVITPMREQIFWVCRTSLVARTVLPDFR
jgi:hypothetical protein